MAQSNPSLLWMAAHTAISCCWFCMDWSRTFSKCCILSDLRRPWRKWNSGAHQRVQVYKISLYNVYTLCVESDHVSGNSQLQLFVSFFFEDKCTRGVDRYSVVLHSISLIWWISNAVVTPSPCLSAQSNVHNQMFTCGTGRVLPIPCWGCLSPWEGHHRTFCLALPASAGTPTLQK